VKEKEKKSRQNIVQTNTTLLFIGLNTVVIGMDGVGRWRGKRDGDGRGSCHRKQNDNTRAAQVSSALRE